MHDAPRAQYAAADAQAILPEEARAYSDERGVLTLRRPAGGTPTAGTGLDCLEEAERWLQGADDAGVGRGAGVAVGTCRKIGICGHAKAPGRDVVKGD